MMLPRDWQNERRLKVFLLPIMDILSILNWRRRCGLPCFEGLPDDVTVVSLFTGIEPYRIGVVLYHPSFPETEPGAIPPFAYTQVQWVPLPGLTMIPADQPTAVVQEPIR